MIRLPALRFALLAAALTLPVTAQVQVFGGNGPRMAATRIFFDKAPVGMMCVQYSQPEWKDSYDSMMDELKGKNLRLGKDFWTTFNTTLAAEIGGVKVPAGAYYFGLKCDDKGAFHLLIIDSKTADEAGWAPFMADQWKANYTCPMTMAATDTVAEQMTMELTDDGKNPLNMTFSVHWGMHKLSVPVVAHLAAPKKGAQDAAAKKEAPADAKKQ